MDSCHPFDAVSNLILKADPERVSKDLCMTSCKAAEQNTSSLWRPEFHIVSRFKGHCHTHLYDFSWNGVFYAELQSRLSREKGGTVQR